MKNAVMFKLLFLCSIILNLFFVSAYGNYPDVTIKPFPIMPWVPPALNEEQITLFRDAGFNVLFLYPDEDDYKKMKSLWDGNFALMKEWSVRGYTTEDMLDFHSEDTKKIGYLMSHNGVKSLAFRRNLED